MINPLDLIAKEASIQTEIPEEIMDKIIKFQWKSVYENASTQKDIEITGLAKLKLRPRQIYSRIKQLQKYINSYHRQLLTCKESEKRGFNKKIGSAENEIEYLKTKIDGI